MRSLLAVKKFYITGAAAGSTVDPPVHHPRTVHPTLAPTQYQPWDMHPSIVLIERYFTMHSQHILGMDMAA
jgi:hypothetical protein